MGSSFLIRAVLLSLTFLGTAMSANTSEEASEHINITENGNILSNPEFSIDCTGCSAIGDLSFSGGCDGFGCLEDWTPDANFSMLPFNFGEYWLGVVFDDFKIHVELDINLTPSQPTNEISIPLLGSSGLDIPFMKGKIFDTDFNFNPQIHGWVNSTTPAHFSYGFDIVIPDHSAIWIPVLHLDNVTTTGFSQSTMTPTNFTSSDPNLQFDFELSFRPTISLNANFLYNIFTESLSFYADIPNINLAVTQALNVTSNCEPAPAGTDPTHIYKNLTNVIPSVSYDVDFSLSHIGNLELGPFNGTALATSCFDYSPQVTGIIPAPVVNPSSGADKSVALPFFSYLLLAVLTAIVMG